MLGNAGRGEVAGRCAAGIGDPAPPAVALDAGDGQRHRSATGGAGASPVDDGPGAAGLRVAGVVPNRQPAPGRGGRGGDRQYCAKVLGELRRAPDALDAIAAVMTRNYVERCVAVAVQHDDPLIYDELMGVLDPRP